MIDRRNENVGGRTKKKRKNVPWKGWGKISPKTRKERKRIMRKCGSKCFLGPDLSFPVCTSKSCRINKKGVWAAYIRSKEWGKSKKSYKTKEHPRHKRRVYTSVSRKAEKILKKK